MADRRAGGPLMAALRRTVREHETDDFLPAVRDYATRCGWLVFHVHDSRGSPAGFPDLVLVRQGRLVFVELKSERGSLSRAQRQWRDALATVAGVGWYCFRPNDRPELERILR